MVKTTYPYLWKYANKWTMLAYGIFFFSPLMMTTYLGHLSWKRGKLPRLCYNDQKYVKFVNNRGGRDTLIHTAALEFYPDMDNRLFMKEIKPFVKKHRYM